MKAASFTAQLTFPSFDGTNHQLLQGVAAVAVRSYVLGFRVLGTSMPSTTDKRLIRVGHSPDPDDAFMFYALAHDKIDTGDLRFRHELQDIETLNRRALRGELEVTAVSIHAYAHLLDKYALCPCGCSMGDRYGPMVVARDSR